MSPRLSRRDCVLAVLAGAALPCPVLAQGPVRLTWDDLLPAGEPRIPQEIRNLFEHDELAPPAEQPRASGFRTDWNGMTVRLPGFIIPIDYDGAGVVSFILAPFVGACIHVPPPPANQLVFVTTQTPYDAKGLFEPVMVTGMFGTTATRTELADIGYVLAAEQVARYSAG